MTISIVEYDHTSNMTLTGRYALFEGTRDDLLLLGITHTNGTIKTGHPRLSLFAYNVVIPGTTLVTLEELFNVEG